MILEVKNSYPKYNNTESDLCSACWNKPEECTCSYKFNRIFLPIDSGLHEHIKILNDKGYMTSFCCESHDKKDIIYIKFSGVFDFNSIAENPPKGFKVVKSNMLIKYQYDKKISDEEFENQKRQQLDILLEWTKSLPKTKNADRIKEILTNVRMTEYTIKD